MLRFKASGTIPSTTDCRVFFRGRPAWCAASGSSGESVDVRTELLPVAKGLLRIELGFVAKGSSLDHFVDAVGLGDGARLPRGLRARTSVDPWM
jgi:hypothetical protein